MDEKKWFLEYSTFQMAFHIETLEEIKKCNLRNVKRKKCYEYVIIAGPDIYGNLVNFKEEIEKEIRPSRKDLERGDE